MQSWMISLCDVRFQDSLTILRWDYGMYHVITHPNSWLWAGPDPNLSTMFCNKIPRRKPLASYNWNWLVPRSHIRTGRQLAMADDTHLIFDERLQSHLDTNLWEAGADCLAQLWCWRQGRYMYIYIYLYMCIYMWGYVGMEIVNWQLNHEKHVVFHISWYRWIALEACSRPSSNSGMYLGSWMIQRARVCPKIQWSLKISQEISGIHSPPHKKTFKKQMWASSWHPWLGWFYANSTANHGCCILDFLYPHFTPLNQSQELRPKPSSGPSSLAPWSGRKSRPSPRARRSSARCDASPAAPWSWFWQRGGAVFI